MGIFGLFHKKKKFSAPAMPELSAGYGEVKGPWESPELLSEPEDSNPFLGSRAAEMRNYDAPDMSRQPDLVSGERFHGNVSSKDIELIMSKLDLISSRLDNLSRRLESIEIGRKPRDIW